MFTMKKTKREYLRAKTGIFFIGILFVSLGCFQFLYQFQKKEEKLNATYTAESTVRKIETQISRYLENAEHGSVLHKWKKLNCIEHLNSTELFHFKSTCQPDMSVFTQQVLDSLVLKEKIQKNEICFLTIDKI